MIYLFFGNDRYESYKAAKLKASNLASESDKKVKILDADELSEPREFTQHLEGIDMFSNGYIIILKRLSNNKRLLKYFEENIDSIKKYDIVLWDDGKIAKSLEKETESIKYEIPFFNSYSKMRQWFTDQVSSKGIKLTGQQIQHIAENHNLDKHLFLNEVEKISLYMNSKDLKNITDSELDSLLTKEVDTEIWDILENFQNRNKVKAAREFLEISTVTDVSQFLITMLDWQISNLYKVKYYLETKLNLEELNMKPKPLNAAKAQAERTNWKDIERMADKLFDLDVAIKSGELDYRTGITLYLLNI
jgi:DNA polymerase III delta subunit